MTKHLKQVLVKSIKFYQCHIIKISFHTTMNVSFSLKPYWSAVILLLFLCTKEISENYQKKSTYVCEEITRSQTVTMSAQIRFESTSRGKQCIFDVNNYK